MKPEHTRSVGMYINVRFVVARSCTFGYLAKGV